MSITCLHVISHVIKSSRIEFTANFHFIVHGMGDCELGQSHHAKVCVAKSGAPLLLLVVVVVVVLY